MDFLVYMDNLGFTHSSGVASGGTPNVAQPIPGTIEDRKHQLSGQSCCPPLVTCFHACFVSQGKKACSNILK